MARLLAFAPKTFDSIMPDKAVEVIEKYAWQYERLPISLFTEISNRRGCFTFDDGVSSYEYSLLFKTFANDLKKRKYRKTAVVYEILSSHFEDRAKEERDEGDYI